MALDPLPKVDYDNLLGTLPALDYDQVLGKPGVQVPLARPKPQLSEFGKGARAFVDETQALGGGAVALGATALQKVLPEAIQPAALESTRQWGEEVFTRNMEEAGAGPQAPKVARIEDIRLTEEGGVERLADWAAYQGTKGIGTLATIAASGGVGGGLARLALKGAVKRAARGVAEKQVEKTILTQGITGPAAEALRAGAKATTVAGRAAARQAVQRGATAGATAAAFGMEGGGSYGQLRKEGVAPEAAVLPSLGVGAVNAALELAPWGIAAKYLGFVGDEAQKQVVKRIRDIPELRNKAVELAKRAVKGAAVGAPTEGITEGVQELVQLAGERWAKEEPLFAQLSPDQWSQIANASAAGALVGGAAGGAVGPFEGAGAKTPQTEPEPTVSPSATTPVVEPPAEERQPTLIEAAQPGDRYTVEGQEGEYTFQRLTPRGTMATMVNPEGQEQDIGIDLLTPVVAPEDATARTVLEDQGYVVAEDPEGVQVATQEGTVVGTFNTLTEAQETLVPGAVVAPEEMIAPETAAAPEMKETPETEVTLDQAAEEPLVEEENKTAQDIKSLGYTLQHLPEEGYYALVDSEGAEVGLFETPEQALTATLAQNQKAAQQIGDEKEAQVEDEKTELATVENLNKAKDESIADATLGKTQETVNPALAQEVLAEVVSKLTEPGFKIEKTSEGWKTLDPAGTLIGTAPTLGRVANNFGVLRIAKALGYSIQTTGNNEFAVFDQVGTPLYTNSTYINLRGFLSAELNKLETSAASSTASGVSQPTSGIPLPSKAREAQAESDLTVASVRQALIKEFGRPWVKAAEEAGLLSLEEKNPNTPETLGATAIWNGQQARLFVDSLNAAQENPVAVAFHELGRHVAFDVLFDKSYPRFIQDLRVMAKKDSQGLANRAYTQASAAIASTFQPKYDQAVAAGTMSAEEAKLQLKGDMLRLLDEEALAYYLQYARAEGKETGLFRQIINAIKAWFAQTDFGQALKRTGLGVALTDETAVALARRATRFSLMWQQVGKPQGIEGQGFQAQRPKEQPLAFAGNKAWVERNPEVLAVLEELSKNKDRVVDAFGGSGAYSGIVGRLFEIQDRVVNEGLNPWLQGFHKAMSEDPRKLAQEVRQISAEMQGWPNDRVAEELVNRAAEGSAAAYALAQDVAIGGLPVRPQDEASKANVVAGLEDTQRRSRFNVASIAESIEQLVPYDVDTQDGWELAKAAKEGDLVLLDPGYLHTKQVTVESVAEALKELRPARERGAAFIFHNSPNEELQQVLNDEEWMWMITRRPTVKWGQQELGQQGELVAWTNGLQTPLKSMGSVNAANAPLRPLMRAKEMLQQGADPKAIVKETGWVYLPEDGKWRYEIDDFAMKLDLEAWNEATRPATAQELREHMELRIKHLRSVAPLTPEEAKRLTKLENKAYRRIALGDFLKHKKLFEAYPWLPHIQVKSLIGGPQDLGMMVPGNTTLETEILVRPGMDQMDTEEVLIHEIQHVIQLYEGLTMGTSPWAFEGESPATQVELYLSNIGEIEARLAMSRLYMTPRDRKAYPPDYYVGLTYPPHTETGRQGGVTTGVSVEEIYDDDLSDVEKEKLRRLMEGGTPLASKPSITTKAYWTTPGDEEVLGLLDKLELDLIERFAGVKGLEIGGVKVGEELISTFDLAETKKTAAIQEIKRRFEKPLLDFFSKHKDLDVHELGQAYAARHIMLDGVNRNLAERASRMFVDELAKNLLPKVAKELKARRDKILTAKKVDGTDLPAKEKRRLMYELMDEFAPKEKDKKGLQEVRDEWEEFKDHASGFSTGEGKNKNNVASAVDLFNKWRDDARFQEMSSLMDQLNDFALDVRLEGGLITQDEYRAMKLDKGHYAPLRREPYDYEELVTGTMMGQGAGKGLGTRIGTALIDHEPVHVIQNSLAKAMAAAAAAQANQARNFMYEQIIADKQGWTDWFRAGVGKEIARMDAYGFTKETKLGAASPLDISFIRKGKRLLIMPNEANQRAVSFSRAVNNLEVTKLTGPMRLMSWANKLIRFMNISASPAFLLANMVRDPLTAAYNLKATEADGYIGKIFKEYGSSFRALRKTFFGNARDTLGTANPDPDALLVEAWEKAGGQISFVESLKEMDTSAASFANKVRWNRNELVRVGKAGLDWIENANIMMENVMRLSAFSVLTRDAGLTPEQAARISKDMTTNFSRRGFKSSALGTWWLFFNATMQGNRQVIVNLMRSKKLQAAVAGTMVFSFMLDQLGRAIGEDDEDKDGRNDWDAISERDKQRNIHFPVRINGAWLKIPAPWVYNVFWRAGQLAGEAVAGVEGRDAATITLELANMALTTFNPIAGGTTAQTLAPTALDPFVQVWENKSFAGHPLGPEGFPGTARRPDAYMAWDKTPQWAKDLAELLNEKTGGDVATPGLIDLRPSTFEVMFDALGGGLMRFMRQAGETAWSTAVGEEQELQEVPIVRQFATQPKDYMTVQLYHDRVAKALRADKALKEYSEGENRNILKAREIRTEQAGELRLANYAKDVERQIKSLRQRLRLAEGRGDDKTAEVFRDRITGLQRRFNEAWKRRMN